jgi:hypothetical protein
MGTKRDRLLPDCGDCGGELALSQPDERLPAHLLGVCRGCGRWFLLTFPHSIWSDRVVMPQVAEIPLVEWHAA